MCFGDGRQLSESLSISLIPLLNTIVVLCVIIVCSSEVFVKFTNCIKKYIIRACSLTG